MGLALLTYLDQRIEASSEGIDLKLLGADCDEKLYAHYPLFASPNRPFIRWVIGISQLHTSAQQEMGKLSGRFVAGQGKRDKGLKSKA